MFIIHRSKSHPNYSTFTFTLLLYLNSPTLRTVRPFRSVSERLSQLDHSDKRIVPIHYLLPLFFLKIHEHIVYNLNYLHFNIWFNSITIKYTFKWFVSYLKSFYIFYYVSIIFKYFMDLIWSLKLGN